MIPILLALGCGPRAIAAPPAEVRMEHLRGWLAQRGVTAPPSERPELALAGWNFYLTQLAPGYPGPVAGVGPRGELVRVDEPEGWYALLGAGTAAELASRVAFLERVAQVADAQLPGVGAPQLTENPRQLTVWLVYPPSLDQAFRVVITATADGRTTFERTASTR